MLLNKMRKTFINTLEKLAEKDNKIILLSADIGFGILNSFRDKFPKNYINTGIGECNAVGIATGMALKEKKPFIYTINPFLVFTALEQIRMLAYMNQQVTLVGVGLEDEYTNNGISHYSFGDETVLSTLPINVLTPKTKEEVITETIRAYRGEGEFKTSYIRLSRF
jgi:transketolase